jgi:hypothetical protein
MSIDLARRLVNTLPSGKYGLFNPWKDLCPDDESWNGPDVKLERLAAHLDCSPEIILCGEAPGYQGCRHSGIAFTSERLLMEGKIPRIPAIQDRLTKRERPFSEPSATIVWNTLYRLGIAEKTILWNAVQLHPYKTGDPLSNRTPTSAEVALGVPAMRMLVEAFPSARIVAVGKKSEGLLSSLGISLAATVRHPANGGSVLFSQSMEYLVLKGKTRLIERKMI